jgi:hypothetical protein
MSGRGDYGIYGKSHTQAGNLWKNKKMLFGSSLHWRGPLQKSGRKIVRITSTSALNTIFWQAK